MNISKETIQDLANEFENCQKILIALGDENRQHLILESPIAIEEEAYPFRSIRKWKGEWNFFFIIGGMALSVFLCYVLSGYTMSGLLPYQFQIYGIPEKILTLVNIGIWLVAYLFITCALFDVKYIFARGVWRFIKEDTLVGSACHKIVQGVDRITSLDFSGKPNRTLLIYCALNALILLLLILFVPHLYSNFLIIVIVGGYAVCSFFWLKRKLDFILDDYTMLLSATKELAQGNFNTEDSGDCGIFHEIKSELDHVGDGFEKAIEEETKSQKMKTKLISNVSHDLKTPLTCIKNYVELLQDENLEPQKRKEYVATLNQYADRLSSMIDDLFEVSKVNSGRISLL